MSACALARERTAGFSLIELMLSMVLGLMLIGGAASLFHGQARSAELGQSIAELQSRARFVFDELSSAVRAAGYVGCAGINGTIPTLPESIGATATPRNAWRPVDGFEVGSGGWLPDDPEGYGPGGYQPPDSGATMPIPGSGALLIEGGTGQGSPIAGVPDATTIQLAHHVPALARSTMGLVTDCSHAEAFFVASQVIGADGTVSLDTFRPRAIARAPNPAFPFGGRVIPYRRALYFVGDTGRVTAQGEPIRALYEHLHPFDETTPHELANGVEVLVLRYRQLGSDGSVKEVGADDADFDPERVLAVRMGLLMSSDGYRLPADEAASSMLAGISVSTDGPGPAHPDDSRLRRAFERSAGVRARSEALLP